jgi:hypothetical protein
MAKVITTELQHSGASGANITLDSSKNVTAENNLQVDGNLTVTGTIPADKLTGALPAISGANLTGISSPTGPNLCRNGVMQIWQRGTSIASSNGVNEGFPGGPDGTGIFYHSGSSGACTISKDTDVPTDTTYGQFKDSLKLDVTTANASPSADHRIQFQHHIEAQDLRSSGWDYTDPNSKMTLSFWAKTSRTGSGQKYCMFFKTVDGTAKSYTTEYTLNADTWTHVSIQLPGHADLTFDADANKGMEIIWSFLVGSNRDQATANTWINADDNHTATSNQVNLFDNTSNNFWLTAIDFTYSDSARIYPFVSYGDELARCQRYYTLIGKGSGGTDGGGHGLLGYGFFESSSVVIGGCALPTTMRAQPSLDYVSGSSYYHFKAGGSSHGITSLVASSQNNYQFGFACTTGVTGTVGEAGRWALDDASAYFAASAEL